MNARVGLQRHSYASYVVRGPTGTAIIRRNGPRQFYVHDGRFPFLVGFFNFKCRRLREARVIAEEMAGIT